MPSDERNNSGRDSVGRFAKGNRSGGRRKGARDRIYREYDAAYQQGADKAIAKIKELALAGDVAALKIWDNHIAPPLKDRPLLFDVNGVANAAEAIEAGYAVTNAMLKGRITPMECDAVMSCLSKMIDLTRLSDLEARLAAIEARSAR
jgi:hypothetical protein